MSSVVLRVFYPSTRVTFIWALGYQYSSLDTTLTGFAVELAVGSRHGVVSRLNGDLVLLPSLPVQNGLQQSHVSCTGENKNVNQHGTHA